MCRGGGGISNFWKIDDIFNLKNISSVYIILRNSWTFVGGGGHLFADKITGPGGE